jgi:hypothetical protein
MRLMRRDVVERMLGYHTAYPYTTGLALMFAHSIGNASKSNTKYRRGGQSNYNLVRILSLVLRILFNYSIWPVTPGYNDRLYQLVSQLFCWVGAGGAQIARQHSHRGVDRHHGDVGGTQWADY